MTFHQTKIQSIVLSLHEPVNVKQQPVRFCRLARVTTSLSNRISDQERQSEITLKAHEYVENIKNDVTHYSKGVSLWKI